jgi:[citrate (pro-3S)-lyase] ligase
MVVELIGTVDRERARAFIERQGLAFEECVDNLVGIFEEGELVAAGARKRNILKMIAIDPSRQCGPLLGELFGELVRLGVAAGHDGLLIFTRPEAATTFEALNCSLLAGHEKVVLLEYGNRLLRYLEACRPLVRDGNNGAVVMNCNPFTKGHRYLVEEAAKRVDTLYLFVVREDRSAFPFAVRYRLVREGVEDLRNVVVLDTSEYMVSSATFPAYFLRRSDAVSVIQAELDVLLFGRRIAPFFGVRTRFFGSEPYCETTRAYNDAMRRILPRWGIAAVEIERKKSGGAWISASAVRAAVVKGEVAGLETLVPRSTLTWLLSEEGRSVGDSIRQAGGVR